MRCAERAAINAAVSAKAELTVAASADLSAFEKRPAKISSMASDKNPIDRVSLCLRR